MAISNRIYRAKSKSTGREWRYQVKESWNRIYYSYAGNTLRFRRTLAEAKQAAIDAGDFRYIDQGPLVTVGHYQLTNEERHERV